MIELKNVSKFYSDNNVVTVGLKNVSMKLNKGEIVAIVGDSGSGKSTLLNVISSIDNYDEGEILFYGNETFYFNQNDSDIFRKNNVSFIFQKYNIIDSYTVLQNVMLPLQIKGMKESEAKNEALEIIKRVGLQNRINNKGSNLSGGEKQRCVIARAIATDAKILACDEPTGNLDSKTSKEIINLIKEVSKDKLVLIVTHDYESIKDVCTRKIRLLDGEVVEDITFKEGMDEVNKPLDLNNSKPLKKTLVKLALSNILSTPKKTIFSTLVFTFVTTVLLLLSLLMIKTSYEEQYTYNDSYGIVTEDRVIIYNSNHDSLDMDKLKPILKDSEYYVNPFYEESSNFFKIGTNGGIYCSLTYHQLDFELLEGVSELNDNEFIIVMPDYAYSEMYNEKVGKEIYISISGDFNYVKSIGKLVGIGLTNQVNDIYLMGKNPNQDIINVMLNNCVEFSYESLISPRDQMFIKYDDKLTKSYIAIPTNLKENFETDFNINGIYDVSYDFDIVYTDEYVYPTLFMNKDFLDGVITPDIGGVKEIVVYTKNINKLTKEVEKIGLHVSIPSQQETNDGLSLIVLYMLFFVVFIALGIMFFISFAIIQRIYITKTKDYSIFRTLGLVSRDILKILNLEILIVTLTSVISGALLTYIIIIITKIDLYKYISFGLFIFYVIVMALFALLTSNRLNKKIFKQSVYQGIREDGE